MEVVHSDSSVIWIQTEDGLNLNMSREKAHELYNKLQTVLRGIEEIPKDYTIDAYKAGRRSVIDKLDFNDGWFEFLKNHPIVH